MVIDQIIIRDTKKYNQGVMFYGAIGIGYKSKLIMCSNGVTAIEYQDIIKKSGMFETLDQRYGEGKYTFMQDGAPAHNAGCTKMFLKKRCSFIVRWPTHLT